MDDGHGVSAVPAGVAAVIVVTEFASNVATASGFIPVIAGLEMRVADMVKAGIVLDLLGLPLITGCVFAVATFLS